jgi:hypothetical protein
MISARGRRYRVGGAITTSATNKVRVHQSRVCTSSTCMVRTDGGVDLSIVEDLDDGLLLGN